MFIKVSARMNLSKCALRAMRCSPHRCCCCHQSKVNIRAGKFPPAEANGVLLPQGAGEARVIRRDDWAGLACRWRILPATAIDARCPDMALRVISLLRSNYIALEVKRTSSHPYRA